MTNRIPAIVCVIGLIGCQSMVLTSQYKGTHWFGESYKNEDGCWSVWEHKTDTKLWIQECPGSMWTKAAVQGATTWKAYRTGDIYIDAVNDWLSMHEMYDCEADDKSEVDGGSGGFVVSYHCGIERADTPGSAGSSEPL